MRYVTLKPPVWEVMEFPRLASRENIKAFLAWSKHTECRKVPNQREWRLDDNTGHAQFAHPGDEFIRPVGQDYGSARRLWAFEADKYQDVWWETVYYETVTEEPL